MELVAVCDQSFVSPGRVCDGVREWSSPEEMLEREDLDALFVCLPNYMAARTAIAALEWGLHVFCEKPPGRTVEEVQAVRAVESESPGLVLMYGFNHRYHDSVIEAMEAIQSGDLGRVLDMRGVYGKSAIIKFEPGEWRSQRALAGGGILLDQGIHMVDMMRLFGGEFHEVHSFMSNSHWGHDVEDNAYILMRADSGVVALLHSSATQWRHRFQLDITLSRGAITLSGILSSTKSYGAETVTMIYPSAEQVGDPKEVTTRFNDDPSWKREVQAFSYAIQDPRSWDRNSSIDALETMKLIARIYEADKAWRPTLLAGHANEADKGPPN